MDKVLFTIGRNSPVDTSSPIKAIRVGQNRGKDDETSLATVPGLGWSSSWNEGKKFGKVKNGCHRHKVGVLLNEEQAMDGEHDSAVDDIEAVQQKLRESAGEVKKLREVNSRMLDRIRKADANVSAMHEQEAALQLKHEQSTNILQEEIKTLKKKGEKLSRDLETQQQLHTRACKDWELERADMVKRIELLELQNKTTSASLNATRCREECESAATEHVLLMMVYTGEMEKQTPARFDEEDAVPSTETNCPMDSFNFQTMDKPEGALEVIPEVELRQSAEFDVKEGPTTPPISPGKLCKLDVKAPEFVRPIPSNISWADLVEDDSRWYEESDEESTPVAPAQVAHADREPAGEADNEPSEEPGWLSRRGQGEFRAFRAFNHYRTSSFDNSSKRSSKRSPRKSAYQSQASQSGPGKPGTQPAPRHQRHKSMDRAIGHQSSDDTANPWPEWNGSSADYGNVQKVSSGVLVVDRKVSKQSGPVPGGPRRTKSDVPQCRRHIAGYCKFEDKCWFRHD